MKAVKNLFALIWRARRPLKDLPQGTFVNVFINLYVGNILGLSLCNYVL